MSLLITPNYDATQDSVGPGIYKVRIINATTGEWKGKTDDDPPTPYINWRLETFSETEDKNNGRVIWHRTPYVTGAVFRFKDFVKAALGEEPANGQPFDCEMLYGREVEVTLVPQRNRPEFNEVKAVRSLRY